MAAPMKPRPMPSKPATLKPRPRPLVEKAVKLMPKLPKKPTGY